MVKLLAGMLGGLLLISGVTDTINPRIGMRVWNWYIRRRLPSPLEEYYVDEQSGVANAALRFASVMGVIAGMAMLWSIVRPKR